MGAANTNGATEVYVSSVAKAAAIQGVRQNTLREWFSRGCPNRVPGKGHPVGAQFRWRLERDKSRTPEPANGEIPTDPAKRKAYFQSERERLKLETETGRLIRQEDHEKDVNDRSAWFVDSLLRIGPALAPRLAGKSAAQAKKIIQTHCRKLQKTAFGEAN